MVLILSGYLNNFYPFEKLREFHYSFGLIGWVTLLIVAISFQVIEMYFVTPKYPDILYRYLIIVLFILISTKLLFESIY